jgi:pyruvate,water dikinase
MVWFLRRLTSGRRAFGRLGKEAPLQLYFEKFHELLECNNRVLEIIAEMREMLTGECIFDGSCLNKVCEELSTLVSKVTYNLNVVGRGEYFELFQVFESIQQRIDAELSNQLYTPERVNVIPFKLLDRGKSGFSGNKAAVLGELGSKLRIPIPPGFAITCQAYYHFLEANDMEDKIEKLLDPGRQNGFASTETIAAKMEEAIMNAEVPENIVDIINDASDKLADEWRDKQSGFAVRSSAVGEDAHLSFAGLYSTFLNVPREEIVHHYKKVVASLFSAQALSYRRQKNILHTETPMAVVVMPMLNPICSGIIFTVDPNSHGSDNVIISAVWGLGRVVADGEGESDYYVVTRKRPHTAVQKNISRKQEAYGASGSEGARQGVPGSKQMEACLSDNALSQLTELALQIEGYFDQPQDIEWVLEKDGTIYVLQARPLLILDDSADREQDLPRAKSSHPVLMESKGIIACRGVGAGKAHHIFPSDSGHDFPEGAVLIARSTSPRLSSLLGRASAVVTDIGMPTGHMATIAREFRVPMIVDTGDATRIIPHGAEVTVDANNNVVYRGMVAEITRSTRPYVDPFMGSPEFLKLRKILKEVDPLHLLDPRDTRSFRAGNCKSYHDIIRFSHEMVVKELIDMNFIRKRRKDMASRRLNFPLPIGLILIDLGDGIKTDARGVTVEIEDVRCLPLTNILNGLLMPGMWSTQPVPLSFGDFMAGMGHTTDPTISQSEYAGRSLAIISHSYLDLSLRFGYHFTMVDCVASEKRSSNYIYFRFVGGITEMARRRRRAQFLSNVLGSYDFGISVQGDLVIARIAKISLPMMEERLFMIGRLLGFSRQLDIVMKSEEAVDHYTRQFLGGHVPDADPYRPE